MESAGAICSISVALNQCKDLIALQETLLGSSLQQLNEERATKQHVAMAREDYETLHMQLQEERLNHSQTRAALQSENERYQFAMTEVEVLRKQLEREKTTFENAFGLLKTQALADNSKVESILAKCTALEAICLKKDEELLSKNEEIKRLERKLREMKESHKRTVQELNVRIQQENYLAGLHNSEPCSRSGVKTRRKLRKT